MTKKVNINKIGEVQYVKSRRAKNMRITVRPFQAVKVTIPHQMSLKSGEKFVLEKIDWIIKIQEKLKTRENRHTVFTENTDFKTYSHSIKIKPALSNNNKVSISINENETLIKYPLGFDVTDDEIQKHIRYAVNETLRLEAKKHLPKRIEVLAQKHNFRYNKIGFRNAKTRWGSCSYDNNLSLNIHLMRLPDYLIDYIILHELCHTKEKNHSKKFWGLMVELSPETLKHDKELKKYSPHIY